MGTLFYIKNMDGKEVIMKQESLATRESMDIDMFLSSHGVMLWWTEVHSIGPAPWSDSTDWTTKRIWESYSSLQGRWYFRAEDQVPKILRMMALTGAV